MNPSVKPEFIASAPPLPAHGRAALIVDDEVTLARNIAMYLERLGWVTQVAGSAEEALAVYPALRPDVVLLDHNLPGKTGLQALSELRAADSHACVVLMTGYGSIDLAVSAIKQGAADYLAKPLALSELKLLLERLLAQHRLESTVDYYRGREAALGSGIDKLLGASAPMVALRQRMATLAEAERRLTDADAPTVLIEGETGTGKELVARALHFGGPRANKPFIELNCGALPPQLVEAELFGYEKGAFTDARQRKIGLVEAAEGGTLFLDEIAEADAATQVKLLKLLEDRRFRRLGGLREHQANVRIVCATHRSLEQMVRAGQFRADLYFRLRIVQIQVPSLRERGGDVLFLAQHFLSHHARRYGRPAPSVTAEGAQLLASHPWPGNVRELRNAMEQVLMLAPGDAVGQRELAFIVAAHCAAPNAAVAPGASPDSGFGALGGSPTGPGGGQALEAMGSLLGEGDLNLERAERHLIDTALKRTGDNVTQAAKLLGISRDTLRYRLERLQWRQPAGE